MAKLVGFINKIYNYVAISYIRPMLDVDSCTVFLTPDSYSRIIWIYAFIIDPHNPSYIYIAICMHGVYILQ